MALGIQTGGGGDFMAVLKYNAKAGRIYRPDRVEENGSWVTRDNEIPSDKFAAVFDLANIEVGWCHFAAGQAPDFAMAPLGTPVPKPSASHKQGFRLVLKLGADCGGDDPVREFASTAAGVIEAIDALHTAYEAAPERQQGKLPVVRLARVTPITSKHGTNFNPTFEIVQWIDRPDGLLDQTAAAYRGGTRTAEPEARPVGAVASNPASAAATAPQPATAMPPPAAQAAAVAAGDQF